MFQIDLQTCRVNQTSDVVRRAVRQDQFVHPSSFAYVGGVPRTLLPPMDVHGKRQRPRNAGPRPGTRRVGRKRAEASGQLRTPNVSQSDPLLDNVEELVRMGGLNLVCGLLPLRTRQHSFERRIARQEPNRIEELTLPGGCGQDEIFTVAAGQCRVDGLDLLENLSGVSKEMTQRGDIHDYLCISSRGGGRNGPRLSIRADLRRACRCRRTDAGHGSA